MIRFRGNNALCLGLMPLHIIDGKLGGQIGIAWGSSNTSGLRLDEEKHRVAKLLVASGYQGTVHVLLDGSGGPNRREDMVIGVNGIRGVTPIANSEAWVRNVKLAPSAAVITLGHINLSVSGCADLRTTRI